MNFRKPSVMGQFMEAGIAEATKAYENVIYKLSVAKQTWNMPERIKMVEEAQNEYNQIEAHYSAEVKSHPEVAKRRQLIEYHASQLLPYIQGWLRLQEAKIAKEAEAAEQAAVDAANEADMELAEDTELGQAKAKIPVVPLAIAGGAIALSLMMG